MERIAPPRRAHRRAIEVLRPDRLRRPLGRVGRSPASSSSSPPCSYDPNESKGISGSLQELAEHSWGRVAPVGHRHRPVPLRPLLPRRIPLPPPHLTPSPHPSVAVIRVLRAGDVPPRSTRMRRAPLAYGDGTDIPHRPLRPEDRRCPISPPAAIAWLAAHHGVITTARAARPRGRPRHASCASSTAGVLRRVAKGVFVIASAPAHARAALRRARAPPIPAGSSPVRRPARSPVSGACRAPSPLHFAVRHGVHLPDDAGCALPPDHGDRDGRPAPTRRRHRRRRRGRGWRSTSPPTSASSITSRSSTSCSHDRRGHRRRARRHRSPPRPSGPAGLGRVPPHARRRSARHGAERVAPRGRPRRRAAPARRARSSTRSR